MNVKRIHSIFFFSLIECAHRVRIRTFCLYTCSVMCWSHCIICGFGWSCVDICDHISWFRCSAYILNETRGESEAHQLITAAPNIEITIHFFHSLMQWLVRSVCTVYVLYVCAEHFCKRFNVVFIESDSWSVKYAKWCQVDNKTIIPLFHVSERKMCQMLCNKQ